MNLPAHAPRTTGEAFAYIGKLKDGATIDDLKILALVEAIGEQLYEDMAQQTDNAEIQALLRANGREEMVHARRLAEVIELLTGETFPIPPLSENPIYTPLGITPVTAESLAGLVEAELGGEDLYEGIARSFDHPGAIALLRQSGKEELEHGARLQQALRLLDGVPSNA